MKRTIRKTLPFLQNPELVASRVLGCSVRGFEVGYVVERRSIQLLYI